MAIRLHSLHQVDGKIGIEFVSDQGDNVSVSVEGGKVEVLWHDEGGEVIKEVDRDFGAPQTLVDALTDIMHGQGVRVASGKMKGWIDSCALSAVCEAGNELVRLKLWERHPEGTGRRWFYRRNTQREL